MAINNTTLTLLAFALLLLLPLLISPSSSGETFEPEVLLCRKDCHAQHEKDWAECEKLEEPKSSECETQSQGVLKRCRRDCMQTYAEELEEESQRPTENIFIFHEQRFIGLMDAEDGYFEVLQRLENRSDVFQGLRNYRMLFARACPSTMMLPSFRNMDSIAVVVNGYAWMTLIQQGKSETYKIVVGDIIRIRAGTIVYYVNPDDDMGLFHIVELTVNSPDFFEPFYLSGTNQQAFFNLSVTNNQQSFYNFFSDDILQAAFNTEGEDEARNVFNGRHEYAFLTLSDKQREALLSDLTSSESSYQQSSAPYNIFKQAPTYINQYGKLYEVYPDDYPEFQDLDIKVSHANITSGAMFGPYHNSKSAIIAMALYGNGSIHVASPHLKSHEGDSFNASAGMIGGDMFVIPAGHPFVTIADDTANLEIVYYEINARGNQRIPLAGMNNVLKLLSKEVKELTFNMPAEQVDVFLNRQEESWFFPGPPPKRSSDDRAAA